MDTVPNHLLRFYFVGCVKEVIKLINHPVVSPEWLVQDVPVSPSETGEAPCPYSHIWLEDRRECREGGSVETTVLEDRRECRKSNL